MPARQLGQLRQYQSRALQKPGEAVRRECLLHVELLKQNRCNNIYYDRIEDAGNIKWKSTRGD